MKKILTAALIAVLVICLVNLDYGAVYDWVLNIKKEERIKDCPVTVGEKEVHLGMSEEEVLNIFGEPKDVFISEYGFKWNIYHDNFKNYLQIGTDNEKVVGIYTNSQDFLLEGVKRGAKKDAVRTSFGEPLDGIVKGNTRYLSNSDENNKNFDIYELRGGYVTFFYDVFKNNSLTSVNIIDCDVEEGFLRLYADKSEELKVSFEMQNFYVTNATRVNEGLPPLITHDGLNKTALSHAKDLAEEEYFSHKNKNGETVLDRALNYGVKFKSIGENLAMGAQNSVYMHELLMNSEGHRKNILADFTHVGVGVAFSDDNAPYLVQNFLK